ncbi:unnamed protein product [Arctia plantaginis]|uniref:Uncharacterized protein n=1 Tax=Arctia plantaginis TaxID=874455 RepID=A0A8S0ZUK3_ARCPL|nr:unnamed protein product [Arctia plantaginis]
MPPITNFLLKSPTESCLLSKLPRLQHEADEARLTESARARCGDTATCFSIPADKQTYIRTVKTTTVILENQNKQLGSAKIKPSSKVKSTDNSQLVLLVISLRCGKACPSQAHPPPPHLSNNNPEFLRAPLFLRVPRRRAKSCALWDLDLNEMMQLSTVCSWNE